MFKKKTSALDKRIKRIEKELSSVSSNIKILSKGDSARKSAPPARQRTGSPRGSAGKVDVAEKKVGRKEEEHLEDIRKELHDERFSDYLASSFESVRPLRHERRIQRNRAIFMVVVVVFVLFVVIYKFFL